MTSSERVAASRRIHVCAALLAASALVTFTCGAQAQVLLNQTNALAGGITPGDAPGFPITLSQPGSYKLSSNLNPPAGAGAIVVTAPGVSIDLNGFAIQGPATCTGTAASLVCKGAIGSDVGIDSSASGTAVRGGAISGMAFAVRLIGDGGHSVERLALSGNNVGIVTRGHARVSHNTLYRNVTAIQMNPSLTSQQVGLLEFNVLLDGRDAVAVTNSGQVAGNVVAYFGNFGMNVSAMTALSANAISFTTQPTTGAGVQITPNACNGATC